MHCITPASTKIRDALFVSTYRKYSLQEPSFYFNCIVSLYFVLPCLSLTYCFGSQDVASRQQCSIFGLFYDDYIAYVRGDLSSELPGYFLMTTLILILTLNDPDDA